MNLMVRIAKSAINNCNYESGAKLQYFFDYPCTSTIYPTFILFFRWLCQRLRRLNKCWFSADFWHQK